MNQFEILAKLKLDVAEAERQAAGVQQKLTNSGSGLATSPPVMANQQKAVELTAKEAEALEKVRASVEKVIAVKKALGESYDDELKKVQQLNRAIEASPLATQREDQARQKVLANPPPVIKPPELPEEEKAFSGRGIQQMLGRAAGAGLMATASVYGAVGLALKKVVDLYADWNREVDRNMALLREYETVNLRIDSMALRLQQVAQHNRDFARSWAEMEKSVANVQVMAAKLLQTEEDRLGFEQRLDEAQTRRALAANALQNRFNPIEELRQREAIEEAAFQRQMQRARELEELKLAGMRREQDMAAARGADFAKEAAGFKGRLPGLGAAADRAQEEFDTTKRRTGLRDQRFEAERVALEKLLRSRTGQYDPLVLKDYGSARLGVLSEGDQSTNLIDTAVSRGIPLDRDMLRARIAEIDKLMEGNKDARSSAAARARATAFERSQAERGLNFAEQEALNAGRQFKSLDLEAQFQQQQMSERQGPRNAAASATVEAMQLDVSRQILETLQNIRTDGNGFGAF